MNLRWGPSKFRHGARWNVYGLPVGRGGSWVKPVREEEKELECVVWAILWRLVISVHGQFEFALLLMLPAHAEYLVRPAFIRL